MSEAIAVPNPAADTAAHILNVAERLFAENGLEKVSIRELVRASGQSNLSAAHYHFGTREALVGALIGRRIRTINELRHQRLDALEAAGKDRNIHAVVSAHVGVVGEVVKTTEWASYYVRVLAQALFMRNREFWKDLDADVISGQIRVEAMLRRLLPDLPPRVFRDRTRMLNDQGIYAIAHWVQTHGTVNASNSRSFSSLIRNTSDFLAAGMGAPLGAPDSGEA